MTQLEAAIDDFADHAFLVKGRSEATVKGSVSYTHLTLPTTPYV